MRLGGENVKKESLDCASYPVLLLTQIKKYKGINHHKSMDTPTVLIITNLIINVVLVIERITRRIQKSSCTDSCGGSCSCVGSPDEDDVGHSRESTDSHV